jgi:hypothetical protein
VEQSVDNPFMAGAAAYPAWLAGECSFFDQETTRKTGAGSTALHFCGARFAVRPGLPARKVAWRTRPRKIS